MGALPTQRWQRWTQSRKTASRSAIRVWNGECTCSGWIDRIQAKELFEFDDLYWNAKLDPADVRVVSLGRLGEAGQAREPEPWEDPHWCVGPRPEWIATQIHQIVERSSAAGWSPVVALPVVGRPHPALDAALRELTRAGGAAIVPAAVFERGLGPYPSGLSQSIDGVLATGIDREAPGFCSWLSDATWGVLELCPGHTRTMARLLRIAWLLEGSRGLGASRLRRALAPHVPSRCETCDELPALGWSA